MPHRSLWEPDMGRENNGNHALPLCFAWGTFRSGPHHKAGFPVLRCHPDPKAWSVGPPRTQWLSG